MKNYIMYFSWYYYMCMYTRMYQFLFNFFLTYTYNATEITASNNNRYDLNVL